MSFSRTPTAMPVLSTGRHRSPRKGACFMELASYLAGEKWSDDPPCTHPVLAALARDVNDNVADASRSRLAALIPDVIGLTSDDERMDAWIAREAALAALPWVNAEKQNVAATAVLACERQLALIEGRDPAELSDRACEALATAPAAHRWALRFAATVSGGVGRFDRRNALVVIHVTVAAIAALEEGADEHLVALLERAIAQCRQSVEHVSPEVSAEEWDELCALTRPSGRHRRVG